jgi:hypothetical protein
MLEAWFVWSLKTTKAWFVASRKAVELWERGAWWEAVSWLRRYVAAFPPCGPMDFGALACLMMKRVKVVAT